MNPKLGLRQGDCVASALRVAGLWPLVFMLAVALCVSRVQGQQTTSPPYRTGTHHQLVREFYSTAQGLPSDDIRALAVTADGAVWVAAGSALVRLQSGDGGSGERWATVTGPSNVTAIFVPPRDVEALAGAADGVWSLTQGQWRKEAGSPAGVIAFAAEPAGNSWALAPSGVWRRSDGWKLVHVLDEDWTQPRGLLPTGSNDCFVAAQSGLFALMGKRKYWLDLEIRPSGLLSRDTRALSRLDTNHFLVATDKGLNIGNGSAHWQTVAGKDGLPILDLTANEEEKQKVRATCQRVTDHILNHGYNLVDKDGQPTTWGVWAPEKLNDDPKWWAERGLNSLEILSHLKVASHLTLEPRYERAARELIEKHHYALNTINAKHPGGVSHDNQLLFLAYYPLLQLERDPALRALYLASLTRTWNFERAAGNPLWNFIYGASTGEPCDVETAVEALREIPLDFILWRMQNSHRADLKYDAAFEREGIKRLIKPLSFTERVIHKWDKNPFLLDGDSDMTEGDPTVCLLPYWMGRHHRLIE